MNLGPGRTNTRPEVASLLWPLLLAIVIALLLVTLLLSRLGGVGGPASPAAEQRQTAQPTEMRIAVAPTQEPVASTPQPAPVTSTPEPTATSVSSSDDSPTQPVVEPQTPPTHTPTPTTEPTSTPTPTTAPVATPTPTIEPTATPSPTPLPDMYVLTEGYVGANLRVGPDSESAVLVNVPYRERVQVLAVPAPGGDGRTWYKVRYDGETGYMATSVLSEERAPVPPTPEPVEVGRPRRFRIDTRRVQVNAPVEHSGLTDDGAMESPEGWWNVGWYRYGPRPGEEGNSVIAGHYDSTTGPAVFIDLADLRVGDVISVEDENGRTFRFRVRETRIHYRDDFPLTRVFGAADGAHLNLITCDGVFSRSNGGYDRRLVVYSDLIER